MTSSLLWCTARDNAGIGRGAVGRMPVVVSCEHASPLSLRTLERQSLCESHRQRRWLTHWSYSTVIGTSSTTRENIHEHTFASWASLAACVVNPTIAPPCGPPRSLCLQVRHSTPLSWMASLASIKTRSTIHLPQP